MTAAFGAPIILNPTMLAVAADAVVDLAEAIAAQRPDGRDRLGLRRSRPGGAAERFPAPSPELPKPRWPKRPPAAGPSRS